ncbi:putative tRNA isopentenyltransferase [Monocercomonoides exilis]|uniref:putative tRNA isopentenyltransferase n=1 Tax=Monocercomonoides exilis TaxID=2049356 RepID=UPI00355A5C58|nr:putative tRNA isopentenyltransferase [Monocercomonoides exilis]
MSVQPIKLVCIIGSTGTGKSAFAIELAKRINGEIINADAMQCYEGLPISTNKPTLEEKTTIPHHLFSFVPHTSDHQAFTILDYVKLVDEVIADIQKRGKIPIVVGGTHYYIEALIKRDILGADSQITTEFTNEEQKLHRPIHYGYFTVYPSSTCLPERRKRPKLTETGLPVAESLLKLQHNESKPEKSVVKSLVNYDTLIFWMNAESDIEKLNNSLNKRVEKMAEKGLEKEVLDFYEFAKKEYYDKNPSTLEPDAISSKSSEIEKQVEAHPDLPLTRGIMQSIGFKEFLPFLQHKETFEQGKERLKAATCKYARKQINWITHRLTPISCDASSHTEIESQSLPSSSSSSSSSNLLSEEENAEIACSSSTSSTTNDHRFKTPSSDTPWILFSLNIFEPISDLLDTATEVTKHFFSNTMNELTNEQKECAVWRENASEFQCKAKSNARKFNSSTASSSSGASSLISNSASSTILSVDVSQSSLEESRLEETNKSSSDKSSEEKAKDETCGEEREKLKPVIGKHDSVICHICNRTFYGPTEWESHVKGRPHQKKKRNAKKREENEAQRLAKAHLRQERKENSTNKVNFEIEDEPSSSESGVQPSACELPERRSRYDNEKK